MPETLQGETRLRLPSTRRGRVVSRLIDTTAGFFGLPRRHDRGWPRFEGGPRRPEGIGSRPPIVLVHGFAVDGGTMLQLGRRLVSTHRVVIPDLPGFGRHAPPAGFAPDFSPGIEPFVDAIDDLIDRLELESPVLVGSSMGGAIVANHAATRPGRAAGIVLIGPAGLEPPVDSEVFAAAKRDEHLLKVEDAASFDEVYALNFVRPPFLPQWIRHTIVAEAAPRAVEYESILRSLESVMLGGPERYRSITCPTEIVWGAEDRIIDASGGPVWRDAIADSRLTIVPEAGHSTMVERPDEVARCVEDLIERVIRRSRSH